MKPTMSVPELIGTALGIIVFALLVLGFQAWLLGLVLSWFNVILTFWQCVGIIVLLNGILSAARSPK
jgi:hypothetical protein